MRTTNYLTLSALVLGSAVAGCSGSASTGPAGAGGIGASTGGASHAGGGSAVGGKASTSVGGGAATGGGTSIVVTTGGTGATTAGGATSITTTGGSTAITTAGGSTSITTTGGSTAITTAGGTTSNTTGGTKANVGGTTGTATGGAAAGGTAGTATGGTKANVGGTTGTATGGVSATGGANGTCTHGAEVLSDFENAVGTTWQVYPVAAAAGTPASGVWYTYKDSATSCTGQTPTAPTATTVMGSEISPAAVSGAGGPHAGSVAGCNNYAMHSTISSCASYSGFGATLLPSATVGSTLNLPVDYSNYDGISFWIKAGTAASGLQVGANVDVEFLTQECKDSTFNGTGPNDPAVDHICHGRLISLTDTNWHQVFIPFFNSGPRSFPATTAASSGNGNACLAGTICEPALMNPKHLQGIQFSLQQPFDTAPTLANAYDAWVDDVALYKFSDTPADQGLAPLTQDASTVNKFPQNKAVNAACTKPAGANGKLIQNAYAVWKSKFVTSTGAGGNLRVVSPELNPANCSVSEGIGYGMLIAVYIGDKALFDGLYAYWKGHATAGTLMNWKIDSNGATTSDGSGSATDADEDAAFAVLEASKQWPSGGYSATTMISDVWTHDIDSGTSLPKGGSNYGSVNPTNPSYFSPAMYREFAKVDTHAWSSVITAVYGAFNTGIGNAVTSGLVSAWCGGGNCSTVSSNGATTDGEYQYDSHRVPWRLALDTCWNGTTTGAGYLNKLIGFFNTQAATGLANLSDIYTTAGAKDATYGAPNSMSLIGCAGVGAMVNSTNAGGFRDRTWQFLLDGMYTDSPSFLGKTATKGGYTYYNATVGLLMMLTMSGNFYAM